MAEKKIVIEGISTSQLANDHFRLPALRRRNEELKEFISQQRERMSELQAELATEHDVLDDYKMTDANSSKCDDCQQKDLERAGSEGQTRLLRSELEELVSPSFRYVTLCI